MNEPKTTIGVVLKNGAQMGIKSAQEKGQLERNFASSGGGLFRVEDTEGRIIFIALDEIALFSVVDYRDEKIIQPRNNSGIIRPTVQ